MTLCAKLFRFVTCIKNYFVAIKTILPAVPAVLIATSPAAAVNPAGGCIKVPLKSNDAGGCLKPNPVRVSNA